MVRLIAGLTLSLIAATAAHAQVPAGAIAGNSNPNQSASLRAVADLTANGFTIPADFVGYCLTTTDVVSLGTFTGSNTSAINLAKMLGTSGWLRFASQDHGTPPAWTQPIANNLAAFMAALGSGWKLMIGLDSIPTNTTTASQQATFIANAFDVSKVTFAFGNEPIISGNFTAGTYETMWNSYYPVVSAAVPGASYASTDDAIYNNLTTILPALTPGLSGLYKAPLHYYTGQCGQSITPSALISKLYADLSPASVSVNIFRNQSYLGDKAFFSEMSAVCGGGVDGISNALMHSTWFLNAAFLMASHGVTAVTPTNIYSPYATVFGMSLPNPQHQGWYNSLVIQSDNTSFGPGAIFYGMYLMSRIQGQVTTKLNLTGNAWVAGMATVGANGNANILLVNNETVRAASVVPGQSSAWSTATVLKLQGSDGLGCSSASFSLGGQPIGVGGTWTGAPYTINNGDAVQIPPCGAALIQIQP
jgi:hypothetical protein